MDIQPIARFHSPIKGKFGLPRQAGIAASLRGRIVLEPGFRSPDALRGLENFDYLWIIWGFDLNREPKGGFEATVRPPRLGGNKRVGVFASRSPYRPNPLGLSSLRIIAVHPEDFSIEVAGADLADGTAIYDIKPYIEYADSHTGIRSGFVDDNEWQSLEVFLPEKYESLLSPEEKQALIEILSQDPRPQYQSDPERIYGLDFAGYNIRFRVIGDLLEVLE